MTISSATPARSVRFQWLRVLLALMVREMGAKFGRSAGGYFWAIAEPLGGIVMLALAFSVALRSPPIGTSFMFFYATGMIPFSLYRNVEGAAASAVRSNRGLLTYPVVTPLDAVLANFILGTLTMMVVGAILFTGIILVDDVHVNFDPRAGAARDGDGGAAGLGRRHAQLRADRILSDLEERLGGGDAAAVSGLGDLLHLRFRAGRVPARAVVQSARARGRA